MNADHYPKAAKGTALFLSLCALTACAAGNAGLGVAPGENVGVHFTCRLPQGEVAVSTRPDAGLGGGERRSVLFMPRTSSDPVLLSAGSPEPLPAEKIRPLEEDVMQQLRAKVLGMRQGETRSFELHAMKLPGRKPGEGIVKLNRVTHFPKEERLSLDEFKAQNRKDPVVGEECSSASHRPPFRGEVVSVSGGEVLIRFSLTGSAVPLFYGTGTLSDAGQDYQLRVDTEAGRLVRNGYVSGRIVQVTANLIAIDFEDQYGGEPLNCEVSVESVQPAVPGAAGVAAQAGTAGVAAQAGTAGVAAQAGTAGVAAQAGTAASGSAQ